MITVPSAAGNSPLAGAYLRVRADDAEVRSLGEELYARLQSAGAEVIYDDRQVSAGVMFSDADLLGVPYRVIISPRQFKGRLLRAAQQG